MLLNDPLYIPDPTRFLRGSHKVSCGIAKGLTTCHKIQDPGSSVVPSFSAAAVRRSADWRTRQIYLWFGLEPDKIPVRGDQKPAPPTTNRATSQHGFESMDRLCT